VAANVVSGSEASASWVERLHDKRCEPSWRYAAEHVSGVPRPQEQEAEMPLQEDVVMAATGLRELEQAVAPS
jgi:hypothetical protein